MLKGPDPAGGYLACVAVAQVEGCHEVGVVLLHAGWPLRELSRLQRWDSDCTPSWPKPSAVRLSRSDPGY